MHFCRPPSGGFEIGFAKRVALKALTSPINGAQELKYDSTNPGMNAWAIKKGRQIIVDFRASRTAIDEIIEEGRARPKQQ